MKRQVALLFSIFFVVVMVGAAIMSTSAAAGQITLSYANFPPAPLFHAFRWNAGKLKLKNGPMERSP